MTRAEGGARVGDLLPALLPALGRALAGEAARERFASPGVASLPLLSGLLLECPLGADAGPAPVGLALRAVEEDDFGAVARVAEAAGGGPWARVARLLRDRAADARLVAAFPEIWLELDLDGAPPPPGTPEPPSVFLEVDPELGRPPRLGPHAAPRRAESAALLARALESLGVDLPDPAGALSAALEALPASARLSYLGAMLPRGERGCRLTLDRMPLDGSCTVFLRALGRPAAGVDADALAALLRFAAPHAASAVLHLDLAAPPGGRAEPGPRLGFELEAGLLGEPGFRGHVLRSGLATAEQLEALDAWPVRLHRAAAAGEWPTALAGHSYLARGVNHLKLVLPGGSAPPGLKAYLSVHWGSAFPTVSLWGPPK